MLVKQLRDYLNTISDSSMASKCEVVIDNGNKLVKTNFNLDKKQLILNFIERKTQ